ncbi:MAG: phosphoenolpyruvate--protein phosphotransferase [Planctomycetaceae bacterium]|nr:phosphoenolpyruvate--protein phosphotransferase [Planctomycetaceae bacterium]
MQRIQGIAVSPGVAIGEALVMDNEGFRIPRRFVARDAVDEELDRLERALRASTDEIARNRDAVNRELGPQYGAIFEAHLQMLNDPRLRGEIEEFIRGRNYSPEYAVSRTLRRYTKVFQSLENAQFAERAHDIVDIEKRLLRNLLGRRREEISRLTSPVLVLAHNLTPSETANLDRAFVQGFVTEIGGPGSHTAIVAGALEIPAVVGLGPFLTDVSGGDVVIIDGNRGEVVLHPDDETLAAYRQEITQGRTLAVRLEGLRDLPAETADGTRLELFGNIEFPHEVQHCLDRGSNGVGLYRTEFLYLSSEVEPTEDVHYDAYCDVIRTMSNRPVVIRTLDLGADKIAQGRAASTERNPCLGLRSIRISLRNLPLFRTQLRAIVRASVLGDVRIMFPLITTVLELRQAKMVLSDVIEDLEENNIPFRRDLKIGMMVEVPAAVIMLDQFVQELDFISIGTNDLTQYTLAVDRDNKDVADLYHSSDPAVLKLIQMAVASARRRDVPVNVCGQMSSNPVYTMLLIGMGLRQLSVTPSAIPEVKRVCRSVTVPHCEAVAARALALENARDVKNYLKEELKKVIPETTAV